MATLVRWEPFREIAALQNDMGRLMSAFGQGETAGRTWVGPAGGWGAEGGVLMRAFDQGETAGRTWVPPVDVWETEGELVYAFDLPGIPEDKISVEFDDGSLTVSGERDRTEEAKDDRFYRYEQV